MQPVELKLKQASAVLGVDPKDLQNLVQFHVLSPRRRNNRFWFDEHLLLQAKVALSLKESLGTSAEMLAQFTAAMSATLNQSNRKPRFVWLKSQPATGRQPIAIRIPLASMAKELEEQLPRAALYRDLPRGRKRPGWKREFSRTLEATAVCLAGVTDSQIAAAIRRHRTNKKRLPEITVVESEKTA